MKRCANPDGRRKCVDRILVSRRKLIPMPPAFVPVSDPDISHRESCLLPACTGRQVLRQATLCSPAAIRAEAREVPFFRQSPVPGPQPLGRTRRPALRQAQSSSHSQCHEPFLSFLHLLAVILTRFTLPGHCYYLKQSFRTSKSTRITPNSSGPA